MNNDNIIIMCDELFQICVGITKPTCGISRQDNLHKFGHLEVAKYSSTSLPNERKGVWSESCDGKCSIGRLNYHSTHN